MDTGSTVRTPIRRDRDAAADLARQPDQRSLWTTFVTLGLILGGLYVALRILKRMSPSASRASQRPGLIEVIATRRLDTQSAVHLVRIGPRVLAVGASPAGLSTLGTFDDPVEIDRLLGITDRHATSGPLFNGSRPVRGGSVLPGPMRPETAAIPEGATATSRRTA